MRRTLIYSSNAPVDSRPLRKPYWRKHRKARDCVSLPYPNGIGVRDYVPTIEHNVVTRAQISINFLCFRPNLLELERDAEASLTADERW